MGTEGLIPGAAGLRLLVGVPLLRPDEQVFVAMLAGWRNQQLAPQPRRQPICRDYASITRSFLLRTAVGQAAVVARACAQMRTPCSTCWTRSTATTRDGDGFKALCATKPAAPHPRCA